MTVAIKACAPGCAVSGAVAMGAAATPPDANRASFCLGRAARCGSAGEPTGTVP